MDKTSQQNAYSQVTKLIDVSLPLFPGLKNYNLGPPQKARVGSEGAGGEAPPCLYSNNSIHIAEQKEDKSDNCEKKVEVIQALASLLSPYHKRQAHTLYSNVERLVSKVAKTIGHVGFLTLTFPDSVVDHKEAYDRFRSMNTNFLSVSGDYGEWINAKERQQKRGKREGNAGAIHYHMIIETKEDIKEGFDFDTYKEWCEGDNRFKTPCPTGNDSIRRLWKDLKQVENYGFGKIFSLEPIHSNAEAIGRYVGKYISKHIGQRTDIDKGARLVNYSRGWLRNYVNFAWNTAGSHEWRRKLKFFAMSIGCQEIYQISEILGPNWAYKYADNIYNIYDQCETIAENKDKIFESPTIKRISGNKIKRQKTETKEELNGGRSRLLQRKKEETKIYMGELTLGYVENWLPEKDICNPLEMALQETKGNLDNYHMKKRASALENYRNEQSIFILDTGEIVPF